MKKNIYPKAILIFLLPIFLLNFLVFTLAWTGPTEPAPGGNVPGFLNVSDTTQHKYGDLSVGGLFESLAVVLIPDSEVQPTCNEDARGMLWLQDNAGEDVVFLCKWDGSVFIWLEVLN